jgi:hypothetical protein
MSHQYASVQKADENGNPMWERDENGNPIWDKDSNGNLSRRPQMGSRHIGLIQKYRVPAGGIMGASLVITADVWTYNSARVSGGGGVSVDAIGVTVDTTVNEVGVVGRVVKMDTTVAASASALSQVRGTKFGFHLTRFFGDGLLALSSGAALAASGGTHVVESEIGIGVQLPTNYALIDSLSSMLIQLFNEQKELLYQDPSKVDFSTALPAR